MWNSNGLVESFIGFGAKKVTIEYSADGTTWTAVENVPEFARAPGAAGYAANTTVSLGGVMAKFVKLTINSTWGGVSPVDRFGRGAVLLCSRCRPSRRSRRPPPRAWRWMPA